MHSICFAQTLLWKRHHEALCNSPPEARREERTCSKISTHGHRTACRDFSYGRNQAVRLPQDLRFPDKVKEVQVRKQGDSILLSPVRPDWASFFSLETSVPDDFLAQRNDSPPQNREPL